MIKYNRGLKANAQRLRREMTQEEKKLWFGLLKKLPITVNRQKVIGNYIVDFYIASVKLVIETDGKQHLTREHSAKDRDRDDALRERGISILRYSNEAVNSRFNVVANDILSHVGITPSELNPE